MSDFISEDTAIGEDGAVTGTLHYVEGVSTFSEDEQDGNFLPLTLDKKYASKEITVTGKKTTKAADLDWLLRVADKDTKFTFEADGKVFLTLTFTGATLETGGAKG